MGKLLGPEYLAIRQESEIHKIRSRQNILYKQEWRHSKKCMYRLQNIACDYQEKRDYLKSVTTRQKDRRSDSHQTKWSLCAAMLRRQHKKTIKYTFILPLLVIWLFYEVEENVEQFVSLFGVWMKHCCAQNQGNQLLQILNKMFVKNMCPGQ